MDNISMIACMGKRHELSYQDRFLWNIPEVISFFQKETYGKPIVMERKVYETLGEKLNSNKNIILSKDMKPSSDIMVYQSINELLKWIKEYQKEVMIIGGEKLYKGFMKEAEKLLLTRVEETIVADSFFPEMKPDDWRSVVLSEHEYKDLKYKQLIYTRKH